MAREGWEFGKLVRQVKGEYYEMPGLCVTLPQACRLWHIDKDTCDTLLSQLVQEHFPKLTTKGLFIRCG